MSFTSSNTFCSSPDKAKCLYTPPPINTWGNSFFADKYQFNYVISWIPSCFYIDFKPCHDKVSISCWLWRHVSVWHCEEVANLFSYLYEGVILRYCSQTFHDCHIQGMRKTVNGLFLKSLPSFCNVSGIISDFYNLLINQIPLIKWSFN